MIDDNFIEWSEEVDGSSRWNMDVHDKIILNSDSTYSQTMKLKLDHGYGFFNSTGVWISENGKLVLIVENSSFDNQVGFENKINKNLVFRIEGDSLIWEDNNEVIYHKELDSQLL